MVLSPQERDRSFLAIFLVSKELTYMYCILEYSHWLGLLVGLLFCCIGLCVSFCFRMSWSCGGFKEGLNIPGLAIPLHDSSRSPDILWFFFSCEILCSKVNLSRRKVISTMILMIIYGRNKIICLLMAQKHCKQELELAGLFMSAAVSLFLYRLPVPF